MPTSPPHCLVAAANGGVGGPPHEPRHRCTQQSCAPGMAAATRPRPHQSGALVACVLGVAWLGQRLGCVRGKHTPLDSVTRSPLGVWPTGVQQRKSEARSLRHRLGARGSLARVRGRQGRDGVMGGGETVRARAGEVADGVFVAPEGRCARRLEGCSWRYGGATMQRDCGSGRQPFRDHRDDCLFPLSVYRHCLRHSRRNPSKAGVLTYQGQAWHANAAPLPCAASATTQPVSQSQGLGAPRLPSRHNTADAAATA